MGEIFITDTAGSQIYQVTFDGYRSVAPAWSPPLDPPKVAVSANPLQIASGEMSTLSWSATDAYSLQIDEDIGPVDLSGAVDVWPDLDTTYRATATGLGGVTTDSVTVRVGNR